MLERVRGTLPLAASVAILTFVWIELGANFTFHWFTNGDLGNGLSLPNSFHIVLPAAFVSWAMFFAAGGDTAAAKKVAIGSSAGGVAALILMFVLDKTVGVPDFWALSLAAALLAFVAVVGSVLGDWYFVPAIFAAFASTLFWWIATGMDGWAPGGGGVNTVDALADPATAGSGAFGGVISTPYAWVFANCLVSLLAGVALGVISVRLAAALTPNRTQAPLESATP